MNQNIVITGATSGIGEVAALRLAADGARIIFVARNPGRANALMARLQAANPAVQHAVHIADLSSIAEMKRVALDIAAAEPVIDVLINNAGAVFMDDVVTVDGLSPTFATNHLAYHVLTLMLLPSLRRANGARIICTASRAHRYATMDFDNLQRNGVLGYAQSKLENLLFVRRLSQLLKGERITVNAFHPGFVATRFADNTGLMWRTLMKMRKRLFGLSPQQGAETLLYLAQSSEVSAISGGYYVQRQRRLPSIHAQHDANAQRLWKLTVDCTGVDFPAR